MKYLKLSKSTLINVNRAACERRLGRPKNPEDISEFLCVMNEINGECELEVRPEDEQWFTETHRGQMTDTRQVPLPTE